MRRERHLLRTEASTAPLQLSCQAPTDHGGKFKFPDLVFVHSSPKNRNLGIENILKIQAEFILSNCSKISFSKGSFAPVRAESEAVHAQVPQYFYFYSSAFRNSVDRPVRGFTAKRPKNGGRLRKNPSLKLQISFF